MPGRDGTGPLGFGGCCVPRTGGAGQGFGLACRRGFGCQYGYSNAAATQKELLQAQKDLLERRLDIVNKQIENS